MAAPSPRSSLPQGFSVYQPALGAQLQFFPALGTQQLDDLIRAHVPGPASIKDKRASISLDFLEHARATGQTFKFYAAAASVAASPLTGSPPSLDSATSSFNVSPVTSSWDWSATASVSSCSSAHRRRPAKANSSSTASPPSRHQTTDFSSLPGMKILTKDGLDVTNSASRGSKTKEQRDHAHLMRIIKACDACRRKKIRCDPSHKKRGGVSALTQSVAVTGSKPSKKTKSPPQEQSIPHQSQPPPPPLQPSETSEMALDDLEAFLTPSFDLDFSFSHLESLIPLPDYTWDDFMQFPAIDAAADYNFHLDSDNYLASQSSGSLSSESPFKASTPQSQQEPGAPPGPDTAPLQGVQAASPQYPFQVQPGSAGHYTDFNLFSPGSSFSEDDRMLSIGSSSSEPMSSQHSLPGFDNWDTEVALPNTAGDRVAGIDCFDASSLADSTHRHIFPPGVSPTSAHLPSDQQVAICCAPGTVALTSGGYDSHVLDGVPTNLNVAGSATAAANSSESSVEPVSRGHADGQADVATAALHSEPQATVSAQDCVATTASSASGLDRLSVDAAYENALHAHLAASDDAHARAPRDGVIDFNDLEGLDADPVRVTQIHTDVGRRVSLVVERMTSEPHGLSASPADAAVEAPWPPAPPGVDSPSPADGAFDRLANFASYNVHPILWQRSWQRTESPDTRSPVIPEGVIPDGQASVQAAFSHQMPARGLTPHTPRIALADELFMAAPPNGQTMVAQDARRAAQQSLPTSERNVVATTAKGVAAALILLTASVMPTLQWAHVVVTVLALAFQLASEPAPSTWRKQAPPAVEGKLWRALPGARQSDFARLTRGLTSMRSHASQSFFSGTSWRPSSAVTLLRG